MELLCLHTCCTAMMSSNTFFIFLQAWHCSFVLINWDNDSCNLMSLGDILEVGGPWVHMQMLFFKTAFDKLIKAFPICRCKARNSIFEILVCLLLSEQT